MDELNNLDRLLEQELPPPQSEIVEGVTPWRQATNRLLMGFALVTVTLSFLGLDYFLPAVGYVLQYLGLRALRRESKGFFACWLLSALRGCVFYAFLIVDATIWRGAVEQSTAAQVWAYVSIALGFAQILCLRSAYAAVQDKAGAARQLGNFTRFAVWYLLMTALALMNYSGWLFGLPMLLAYFFILRSLHRLSRELDEAGYSIEAAPVRVPDRSVIRLVVGVTLLGIACGYLFLRSYPMDFAPREPRSAGAQIVADELAALGFPAEVLDDLTDADILACAGAERVVVRYDDTRRENSPLQSLRFTGVAVELPGERGSWRLFHYFRWDDPARFYGTEAIALRTDWEDEYWTFGEEASGRVLCDGGDGTRAAPYDSLQAETFTQDSFLFGPSTRRVPIAAFSFPRGGTNRRCYLTYKARAMTTEPTLLSAWVEYVHQTSWLQYPVETAKEFKLSGKWSSYDGPFAQMQTAIQFFPEAEALADEFSDAYYTVTTAP